MNNDEQRQRAVALAIHAALQQCSAIMARWRAGARFSVAAQHDLCQEAAAASAPLGDVAGAG